MSRILAVDWGRRRIGLAVSDPTGTVVRPLPTLNVTTPADAVRGVTAAAEKEEASTVLLGLPLNMDGGEGASAREVRALGESLAAEGLSVIYHDERMTTEAAREYLRSRGERRPDKSRLDQVAALLLLENYLETRSAEGGRA